MRCADAFTEGNCVRNRSAQVHLKGIVNQKRCLVIAVQDTFAVRITIIIIIIYILLINIIIFKESLMKVNCLQELILQSKQMIIIEMISKQVVFSHQKDLVFNLQLEKDLNTPSHRHQHQIIIII